MTILGIDPGLATMGWGAIHYDSVKPRLLDYGALTTPADMPMPQRLLALFEGVEDLCRRFDPDDIAMEELFFCKNVTTAIAVGEARGAAIVAMRKHTIICLNIHPCRSSRRSPATARRTSARCSRWSSSC